MFQDYKACWTPGKIKGVNKLAEWYQQKKLHLRLYLVITDTLMKYGHLQNNLSIHP